MCVCEFVCVRVCMRACVCACVCVRADGVACQTVTWLLSCVFTGFARFTCSAAKRLKDKRERGGVGELLIIWCCLSCIIPRFQMQRNLLMKPRRRTIEGRGRRKGTEWEWGRAEPALFLWCINVNSWQGTPPLFFTKFVFSRLAFWLHQRSDERPWCRKAAFDSLKKQSAVVSFVNTQLLPCTCRLCGISIKLSSSQRRKVSYSPLSN